MDPVIELTDLLARESEQVEWKEQVADAIDVVRTLVAFSNDLQNLGGGRVVCGAAERKDEHGFPMVDPVGLTAARIEEVRGRVVAICRNNVHPSITPQVAELPGPSPDRRLLVFTAIATGQAHAHREQDGASRFWVRIDKNTIEARNGVLMRLLAAKGQVEPWDRRVAADATLDDIDLLALRDTLVRIGRWDPARGVEHWLDPLVSISTFVPPLCGRDGAGVVRPRVFALLLFGRATQRFVPGAVSTFSIYPGPDRTEPYSERLELDGTLVAQAARMIERLNVEAVTVMDKSGGGADNIVRYPHRALKEAVVNALVHRDYTSDQPTRVVVYSDRVEIWSPGGLDPKVPAERFREGRASPVWRNRALAWIFARLDLAQAEGQGISTILASMEREGCPPPRFDVAEESVTCVLPAHPRHGRMRELQRIERMISLGQLGEATASLEALLEEDPTNFRTLSLLTEVVRTTRDDAPAVRFVVRHRDVLEHLPGAAQLALADALATGAGRDTDRTALVKTLLARAGLGRLELADTRRLVLSYLGVQDEGGALRAIERALGERPEWVDDPGLRQLRGNTWIQFAKRCRQTLDSQNLTPRLRMNARRDLLDYLDRAEADLRAAVEHGAVGVVRDKADDDLRYVESLRRRGRTRGR